MHERQQTVQLLLENVTEPRWGCIQLWVVPQGPEPRNYLDSLHQAWAGWLYGGDTCALKSKSRVFCQNSLPGLQAHALSGQSLGYFCKSHVINTWKGQTSGSFETHSCVTPCLFSISKTALGGAWVALGSIPTCCSLLSAESASPSLSTAAPLCALALR